jgi:hypothetical protein
MKPILLLISCWALTAAPNRAPLQANAFQPLPLIYARKKEASHALDPPPRRNDAAQEPSAFIS